MLAIIGIIALIGLVYFLSRKPAEVAEARLAEVAPDMEIAVATQKVIKEEAIAKVAPEIIAEVQIEALSADRPITTEEAKEISDAIAEAVGVPITDPAPAQAVYEETGVVPAGHWGPLTGQPGAEVRYYCGYCGYTAYDEPNENASYLAILEHNFNMHRGMDPKPRMSLF